MASLYSGFQLDPDFDPYFTLESTSWSKRQLAVNTRNTIMGQMLAHELAGTPSKWQTMTLADNTVTPFTFTPETTTAPDISLPDLSLSGAVLARAGLSDPEVASSVVSAAKNAGKLSSEASDYYNRAKFGTAVAAGATALSGITGLISAYQGRDTVRLTNKQLDTQKKLIDVNIANNEAVANDNFKNAIADLQVLTAAKNVDIRSQAVRSDVVQGGEDLGEDMALRRAQGSLQKKAIDFQKAMNKAQQAANEQQGWINLAASGMSAAALFI